MSQYEKDLDYLGKVLVRHMWFNWPNTGKLIARRNHYLSLRIRHGDI